MKPRYVFSLIISTERPSRTLGCMGLRQTKNILPNLAKIKQKIWADLVKTNDYTSVLYINKTKKQKTYY